MTRRHAFVVVTSQRAGSTLLVRSLDASPDIFCAGEIFYRGAGIHHPEMQYRQAILGSEILGRAFDVAWGRQRVERHLLRFYGNAGPTSSAVGFKVMMSQLKKFPAVMPFLLRERVTCIFLYRRDVVATALSYCRARLSGVYHADRVHAATTQPTAVEVNASDFGEIVAACVSDRDQLVALHRKHGGHLLAYEDLIGRWDETIMAIGRMVGLTALAVPKALPKLADVSGHIVVTNERALRRDFAAEARQ